MGLTKNTRTKNFTAIITACYYDFRPVFRSMRQCTTQNATEKLKQKEKLYNCLFTIFTDCASRKFYVLSFIICKCMADVGVKFSCCSCHVLAGYYNSEVQLTNAAIALLTAFRNEKDQIHVMHMTFIFIVREHFSGILVYSGIS